MNINKYTYSKILLNQCGWHGTRQVLNCQIFHIIREYLYWPKFLQVIFCYCFYTWAVQWIRGIFHLDIFSSTGSGSVGSSSVFSGMFIAEEVNGARREGGQEIPEWLTDTLGGLFEHVPETCLFHWCSFYLLKDETSYPKTTFLKCQIIKHF